MNFNKILQWAMTVTAAVYITEVMLQGKADADIVKTSTEVNAITESVYSSMIFKNVSAVLSQENYQSRKVMKIAKNTSLKASDYLKSGEQKYDKKDFRGALADFEQAIQLDPNYARAYNARGFVKHRPPSAQFHNFKSALADQDRAIQLDPSIANFYDNRGNLKTDEFKDHQGAMTDFNRAIQLDPNYAKMYGNRGELKHNILNDKAGGIADVQKAVRLFKQQGNMEQYGVAIGILKKWQENGKNPSR